MRRFDLSPILQKWLKVSITLFTQLPSFACSPGMRFDRWDKQFEHTAKIANWNNDLKISMFTTKMTDKAYDILQTFMTSWPNADFNLINNLKASCFVSTATRQQIVSSANSTNEPRYRITCAREKKPDAVVRLTAAVVIFDAVTPASCLYMRVIIQNNSYACYMSLSLLRCHWPKAQQRTYRAIRLNQKE